MGRAASSTEGGRGVGAAGRGGAATSSAAGAGAGGVGGRRGRRRVERARPGRRPVRGAFRFSANRAEDVPLPGGPARGRPLAKTRAPWWSTVDPLERFHLDPEPALGTRGRQAHLK